jgi:PLP dependent protein
MQNFEKPRFIANLENIKSKIARACDKTGRNPLSCEILAVTKNHSRDDVLLAIENGMLLFGENRVQEAKEKYSMLRSECELHLIGHLQRNKAKDAAALFSCVQSIHKAETVETLHKECERLDKIMDVLIEYNTSGEASKFGIESNDEYWKLLDYLINLKYIRFRGLMTVGPLSSDESRIRTAFSFLKSLFDETRSKYKELSCDILSMGMSADFEIAVEEGSTLVRIGTALFGER